jgi:hypothetical protein
MYRYYQKVCKNTQYYLNPIREDLEDYYLEEPEIIYRNTLFDELIDEEFILDELFENKPHKSDYAFNREWYNAIKEYTLQINNQNNKVEKLKTNYDNYEKKYNYRKINSNKIAQDMEKPILESEYELFKYNQYKYIHEYKYQLVVQELNHYVPMMLEGRKLFLERLGIPMSQKLIDLETC